MFTVVDNEFNRANYPDMIGKTFEHAPSYAHVVHQEEIFDPEKAEKYFRQKIDYARKSTLCGYGDMVRDAMDFGLLLNGYVEDSKTLDERVERTHLINEMTSEFAQAVAQKLKIRCGCKQET